MKTITRENIWKDGEYSYEAAYGFEPNMRFYLHDDESKRPFLIVVPGGGYCMCVPPEAEIVARDFYERGMNCAVLTYTTDITMCVPLHKQPMNDLSRAVRYVRKNAERLGCDTDKLVVCGFSAGAHVCGSVGVHFKDCADPDPELSSISNRPDAMFLCYPVITSGEFTHIYSMWALAGQDSTSPEYDYFSLEKHVGPDTTPAFIWQTVTDDLVPVENSALFAAACRKAGVPYTYHAFPRGFHGLSICNESWFKGDFGEPYTMEQVDLAVKAVKEGRGIRVPEKRVLELKEQFKDPDPDSKEEAPFIPPFSIEDFPDVKLWPDLAMAWLKGLFS